MFTNTGIYLFTITTAYCSCSKSQWY